MAFMTWDDSYSVQVQEIDEQHKKLVEMINGFYDQMMVDSGKALRTLLDSLVNYVDFHFTTEEKYFAKFGYPDSAKHIEEHRAFARKVLDVKDRMEKGLFVVSLEVTNFLRDWLVHHIKESDKAYSAHFRQNGLS